MATTGLRFSVRILGYTLVRLSKLSTAMSNSIDYEHKPVQYFRADYESPVLSNSTSNGHLPSPSGDLELLYRQADSLLAYEKEATLEDRREAYDMMKQHYLEVSVGL